MRLVVFAHLAWLGIGAAACGGADGGGEPVDGSIAAPDGAPPIDAFAPSEDASTHDAASDLSMDARGPDASDTGVDSGTFPPGELPAFPSAVGAAAFVEGFRGGRVLHVTTLDDDYENPPVGSYRWAITREFPRIIVFDVSGVIELSGWIYLDNANSNVYVAGQTSPGGIMIRGYSHYLFNLTEFVWRYVKFYGDPDRVRAPNDPRGARRPLMQFESPEGGIVDHCSFVFNENEAINFWGSNSIDAGSTTLQRSIVGEGNTGVLMGGDECSTRGGASSSIENLFVHIRHRTPNFTADVLGEAINNVVYNWRTRLSRVSCTAQANFYGNYYKTGSASFPGAPNRLNLVRDDDGADVYLDERYWNYMDSVVESDADERWQIFRAADSATNTESSPQPEVSAWLRDTPVELPGRRPTITSSEEAYERVLADVGANRYLRPDGSVNVVRDAKDAQYVSDVRNRENTNGRGSDYGNELGVFDFPTIERGERSRDHDTDGDGMPNVWERAQGLDENTPDDDQHTLHTGYTNIEVFLSGVDRD
ncbi:MAG: hypothetical protein AAF938_09770 [Myxococcota bacterium]